MSDGIRAYTPDELQQLVDIAFSANPNRYANGLVLPSDRGLAGELGSKTV